MEISSFEAFAENIRNFTNWGDRGGYDFGGSVYLLGSCLDNLRKHATQVELEELAERLEPEQIAFLNELSKLTRPP